MPEVPKPTGPNLEDWPKQQPQPQPRSQQRRGRPAQTPAVVPAADAAAPVQPETAPPVKVPRLTTLMTEEQRRAYDQRINSLVEGTRQRIAATNGKNLNAAQREAIARAESFIGQALELRTSDPEAAQGLAERAELLTREFGK